MQDVVNVEKLIGFLFGRPNNSRDCPA